MGKAVLVLVTIITILSIAISAFFLLDSDGDGLSNLAEIQLGSDFGNPDTDSDGLSDGAEVNIHRTSPLTADSDSDGLDDKIEIEVHKTDPLAVDTDNDGLNDGIEVVDYSTNPLSADTDNDDLNDWAELFSYGTNPLLADTDNDELSDFSELNTHGTNPLANDSDNDGLQDGLEVNGWSATVNGSSVNFTSNPLSTDSDYDNLTDWAEYNTYSSNPKSTDTDGDGSSDLLEVLYNTNLSDTSSSAVIIENAPAYPRFYLEIDYMMGYAPAPEAINYIESYFENDLGVMIEVTYEEITNDELEAIGVSTDSISAQELNTIESNFHDNPTTYLYVFYANELSEEDESGGLAANTFGVAMNGKYLPGRLDREKTILLHEIGHCLGLEHCDNSTCAMQIIAIFENPIYCNHCWSQRNLLDIWSVDEPWV